MLSEIDELPVFGALNLHENATGWGPVDIPKEFEDMPYQPFAKDTRLGKVADWSGNVYQDMKSKGRYMSQFSGAQYAYIHDEDDSNFQLVSSGRDLKNTSMRPRYRFPMRGRRGGGVGGTYGHIATRGGYAQQQQQQMQGTGRRMRGTNERDRMMNRRWNNWHPGGGGGGYRRPGGQQYGGYRNQFGGWDQRRQPHRTVRDASVQIKDSWVLQDELDFARLSKLALPSVKDPKDLVKCGEMEYYDKSYDRISTKNERPLVRVNRVIHTVSTTDDPIIRRLAKEQAARVYCTDAIAARIMCCTRSVNPWDLVVTRVDDLLFFDERAKAEFDLVTVCETAAEPPNEEPSHINSAQRLSLEATYINTNLSQQMLKMGGKKFSFPLPNPFIDEDEEDEEDDDEEDEDEDDAAAAADAENGGAGKWTTAGGGGGGGRSKRQKKTKQNEEYGSIGYRYRLFDLGNDTNMVVRCEVNGVLPQSAAAASDTATDPQYVCIRALNEFDSRFGGGVDWRSKLDTQRGAVLASEIKNNAFKLAKWTMCSILAGADQLKLGFVSRVNPKDSSHHVILGTEQFKPQEFAQQLNLNLDNAWGILRCVVDFFMKLPEGKYLLLKDPNRSVLRLFTVPMDAFDSDEGESNTSSDDEEEAAAPSKQPIESKTDGTTTADEADDIVLVDPVTDLEAQPAATATKPE